MQPGRLGKQADTFRICSGGISDYCPECLNIPVAGVLGLSGKLCSGGISDYCPECLNIPVAGVLGLSGYVQGVYLTTVPNVSTFRWRVFWDFQETSPICLAY